MKYSCSDDGVTLTIGLAVPISNEGRPKLLLLALADGYESIAEWIAHWMNDVGEAEDVMAERIAEWSAYDPVRLASEILDSACAGWSPFERQYAMDAETYWSMAEDWLAEYSGEEYTDGDRASIRAIVTASFEHDAKRARELAQALIDEWDAANR